MMEASEDIEQPGRGTVDRAMIGNESPELAASVEAADTPTPAFSTFSKSQKRWIIPIAALAGWFSTASSFIYFPAIPFLAQDLDVSVQNINLTVTSYLIASGVFPFITGSLADMYGRRLAFIVSLGVYAAVNLGLALQRSFPILFALRMLQSAAISGTFSIAYGVVGDLTTPAERGGYTGVISVFVAPLISGLSLIRWTWPAVFWFLFAATCVALAIMVLFMPETCRLIVGNGSIAPSRARLPLFKLLLPQANHIPERQQRDSPPAEKRTSSSSRLTNPFASWALLKNKGTIMVVLCYAIYYTIWSCLQATLSTVFVDVYSVSGLAAGLCYIPSGVACSIASFMAGKIIDRDYARIASQRGLGTSCHTHTHIVPADFPIEYARFRTNKHFIVATAPLIVAYGWALQTRLTYTFGHSPIMVLPAKSLNTLLVDYYPDKSASAQAANNLVTCEMAAAGLAVVDIMIRRLGVGWCFVVFAALHAVTLPLLWVLEKKGVAWRPCSSQR
ncbi:hypothetical protein PG994_013304 [Apiospora phragmitis]|uniref:Major facilitator superfamily (MFS) profile domain-containing protein n=1 Tax=Apiospora phragmitis TaxID=2905665 RepID=A0ABR1T898_9PEZI